MSLILFSPPLFDLQSSPPLLLPLLLPLSSASTLLRQMSSSAPREKHLLECFMAFLSRGSVLVQPHLIAARQGQKGTYYLGRGL